MSRKRKKPVFVALSPNVEKEDFFLALRLLFSPWKWRKGVGVEKLEKMFKSFLGVKHAFAFNSGRSSLIALFDGLEVEGGNEALIQGFTCNALVNCIRWSGLFPRYVDIEKETLNMNLEDLERKIGERSKVVVAQHTFGQPAPLDEIKRICEKNNLVLIEDCAHALGATYKGKKVGTFGEAAFFSLGRSKVASSVYGGVVVTDNDELAERIDAFRECLNEPSSFWVLKQLLHPVLTEVLVKPLYGFMDIGRLLLILFQKVGILSKAVHRKEKVGRKPSYLPKKMPNALALLGIMQLAKIERFIYHQRKLAAFYRKEIEGVEFTKEEEGRIYMRFPVLLSERKAKRIRRTGREENIFLDDGWHTTPVVPPDTVQKKMKYYWGECPVAESTARRILNLPTNINVGEREAFRIRKLVNENK